ncbi:Sodium/calcium exchanger NCL1 [Glycine soja]
MKYEKNQRVLMTFQKRRLEYVKPVFNIEHIATCPEEHPAKDLHQEWNSKYEDGSSGISAFEVKDLLLKNKGKEIKEMFKVFDLDGHKKINMEEFDSGFTKWLDQTKHALEKQYFSRKSLKDIYQTFGPWIENKRKECEGKKQLIFEILRHAQSDVSELKELIVNIKFVKASMEVDEAVALVIEELGIDRDRTINEKEFVVGFEKWFSSTLAPAFRQSNAVDKSIWAWIKAITYVMLGIIILSILAELLTVSVHNFSNSAGLHPFFMSFILAPLVTNAREAT